MIGKELEYDVLGCRIKIRDEELEGLGQKNILPSAVVEFVLNEIAQMKSQNAQLDEKQLAVLLALQFAKEKLILESSLDFERKEIYKSANAALRLIEEVCPPIV